MSHRTDRSSYVALHVVLKDGVKNTIFSTMYKVTVKTADTLGKTVQNAFAVVKDEVHAPSRLLAEGEMMLGGEASDMNKRCSVKRVMMPTKDCALVDVQSWDVSRRNWHGILHEGVLEVDCEDVRFETGVPGVHLQCGRVVEKDKTLATGAPTGISTIKQTPKEEIAVVKSSHGMMLHVAAWVLPSVDKQTTKQMYHFLSMNHVMRPLKSVLLDNFGRATQSRFEISGSMPHRDVRIRSKKAHLAAAANVLGHLDGLKTTKRQSHNFTVWQTATRVGESACQFYTLLM
jgi:hypothetical protein